jgi:hypothetical protein
LALNICASTPDNINQRAKQALQLQTSQETMDARVKPNPRVVVIHQPLTDNPLSWLINRPFPGNKHKISVPTSPEVLLHRQCVANSGEGDPLRPIHPASLIRDKLLKIREMNKTQITLS